MTKTIYVSILLKDNKIMSYRISPNKKTKPTDFYKDFYYTEYDLFSEEIDRDFTVECIGIQFEDNGSKKSNDINNYIFEEVATTFMKFWEIHPDHFGAVPY